MLWVAEGGQLPPGSVPILLFCHEVGTSVPTLELHPCLSGSLVTWSLWHPHSRVPRDTSVLGAFTFPDLNHCTADGASLPPMRYLSLKVSLWHRL